MAKRSERISIVVELALRKQDSAAERLREAQQLVELNKKKLQELNGYYDFYAQQAAAQHSGLRASTLGRTRIFLEKMHVAISSQKQQLTVAERQALDAKEVWHLSYLKLQSLRDLQQRYRVEESAEMDRREQRSIDEWVTQRQGR